MAIVGGAKVSDKIDLLQNFSKIADTVLVGGAMAYTFLKAQGIETGKSRTEDDKLDLAKSLLADAASRGKKFLLPTDHIVADKFDVSAVAETVSTQAIPADRIGLDIGPATRAVYTAEIEKAKTIVWNGPMGVFEMPQFAEGTLAIAKAVAASSAITIVGGGDSVAAVKKMGVADKIDPYLDRRWSFFGISLGHHIARRSRHLRTPPPPPPPPPSNIAEGDGREGFEAGNSIPPNRSRLPEGIGNPHFALRACGAHYVE